MQKIIDNFFNIQLQPQIFSMILVTLILIVLAIVIYLKVQKQTVDKAPHGILQIAEQYVMGVDNLFKEITKEQIHKPGPYIFTLLTFLIAGNLISVIGVESVTTSYSTTLTLALISWIGIYVVGITHQRWRFLQRYINPIESISQFAPLISLSFRLFGNLVGGSTIIYLLYYVTASAWSHIPFIGQINLLGPLITPFFHAYLDIFGGLIQAYVFTLLTTVFWTLEAGNSKVKVKNEKQIKINKNDEAAKTIKIETISVSLKSQKEK